MKQIVDKLNKIAKKINENVELSDRDLIIDSLDSITKAYGGTPNDSNLIVDKLEDIYNNIGPAVSGNIEITENGENINVAPYATATVNVSGGGGGGLNLLHTTVTIKNESSDTIQPDCMLFGYAVLLSDFSELNEHVLHTTTTSENPLCQVNLSDLNISIGNGESFTFNAYYANYQTTQYSGGIIAPEQGAIATNMTYDSGWGIVDATQNSTLTITIGK